MSKMISCLQEAYDEGTSNYHIIQAPRAEKLKLLSPPCHMYIGSPLQYPHQVVVWHFLEHFSACELTPAHSVRRIGFQVLYRRYVF